MLHCSTSNGMKALTLLQANVAPGETTCGRSLSSNYAPPSLENKLLAQTSTLMPQPLSPLLNLAVHPSSCPSLQPSSLSSTSSSLLSTSSFSPSLTSPLLSTENKLLSDYSPSLSFSLTSSTSVPNDSQLFPSLASSALLSRFAHPPSFLPRDLGGEQKRDDGGDEDREETSEVMQSSFEESSVCYEDDDISSEEQDMVAGAAMEVPALETELANQELEQTVVIRREKFAEIDRKKENMEEELKDKKYLLLNMVCCSLVSKSTTPGQKDWDSENSVWTKITNLAKDISVHDPQFLLKVAVYTRQELNIRITANFLLALAANQPTTKQHVRRYFCAAVQLPSDWLEVVRIYSTCFSRSLPMCLKKAMADKFKQFNEYQLAKYNTRKHRCKHNRNGRKTKKPNAQQLKLWANLLRSDASILEKFLQVDGSKKVVDKKQSDFSMKKMIKKLHIKEPAEHVMAILGRKYPADLKAFIHSGIKGSWDRERAGKRMKLKEPETWERLLSLKGNKAATWERLLDNKSLPFMAMLRNLRNMITKGISEAHHEMILNRLKRKKDVIQSRQFPIRFLAAYKVIMELYSLATASEQAVPPVKDILKGILSKIPKSKRFKSLEWDTTPRSRIRVTLGVPFIYRLYRAKKAQLLKANQKAFTIALLDRYRKALETAVQLSCRYNIPPLPGRTIVLLPTNIRNDRDWCQKQDFCLPPNPEQKNDEEEEEEDSGRRRKKKKQDDKLTPSAMEMAVLLSLMIGSSAEDGQLCLIDWNHCQEVKLESDVLLDNVRSVIKQAKVCSEVQHEDRDSQAFSKMLTKKNKVDNFIVLTDYWINHEIEWAINNYRREINNKALVVQIFLAQE